MRKYFLLDSNIGPCVCHFWNFRAWICQNCIQNVQLLFKENFFGKILIVTLGPWSKIFWYFIGDFLAELSKCNIKVQGYFLRKNTFIREKSSFYCHVRILIPFFFGHLSTYFPRVRQNWIISVQLQFQEINFFEKIFGQFRSLSECVPVFSRKKFNLSLQKFVLCAHMKFLRKIFVEFFFLNLFGKRAKFCNPSANNFNKVSKLRSTWPWEQFEEIFCLKNSCFCFSIVFDI